MTAVLPQSNATLLSVSRGGYTEDYDAPSTSDATNVVWEGEADTYVRTRIVSTFNQQGESRRVSETTLIVSNDLPVRFQVGDIVTYEALGSNTQFSARVQTLDDSPGLPYLDNYVRCALEEVNAQPDNG